MASQFEAKTVDLFHTYRVRNRHFHAAPYYDPRYAHHFPFFGFGTVEMMMRDSRIKFALNVIKGPIYAYTKFFSSQDADDPAVNQAIIDLEYYYSHKVSASNQDTEDFILKVLNRFWEDGLTKALKCIEWGYSPNQVVYERDIDGKVIYKTLMSYSPLVARPVSLKNKLTGIHFKTVNKYIPIPKSSVFVHQREYSQFTGQSRLLGAHIPWHETWQIGGARDIRRIWYYRNSYDSGTLYFPEGSITDESTGETRTNAEIAMEIMEATQTGSYRVLPKPPGSKNTEKSWDYEAPKAHTTPDGILEYPQDLRSEILEGMGIPREVIESAGSSGFGSATGRKVPMLVFISSLMPIVTETLADFRSQILNPLLKANQLSLDYEISRIIPKIPQPKFGQPRATNTLTQTSTEI